MILFVSACLLILASGVIGGHVGWHLGTREIYRRPFEDLDGSFFRPPAPVAITYARRARDRTIRTALYATLSGAAAGAATLAVLPT